MPKMKRQTRPPVRFAEAHFMGSYDRTAGGTLPPPPTTAVSAGREHAHQSQFQAGRMLHLRLSAQNRTGTQAHPARPPAHSPSYIFDVVCVCVLTPERACTHLRPCLPRNTAEAAQDSPDQAAVQDSPDQVPAVLPGYLKAAKVYTGHLCIFLA